ncbi:ADP-ribosyltransferase [Cellulomonas chengniuliangii]|uniref:ADP-ribosyltransferase n=1 Tax=Cellulomonas chengniuliangii TaxID=2968084 RepID=A0ABY5KXX7_9CELL|nr:ADP-ribosyltransferase [Cellulomonas chengniuliangii]MCC2307977.1 ADP-ribosyltransferase [Cellulomonas chengniuliangii]UUI75274.1 ADP-ribosyltransferase [Cellulomonas chengniuliangii]
MSANPLVAGPVNTSSAFGGLGVVESVADLCSALESGSWLSTGMAGVGAVMDVAATVIDPLGSLIAAGLGWLMEHLQPLKGWLNDLTGDAGAVLGFAGTWDNVAGAMGAAGDELVRVVRADLEDMSGESITAYAAYADALAERIRVTGDSASAMGSALTTCAMVVQVVHDLVRDTLAQLVGSIISWAAEAVFTLGLATPVIVGQVSTRVSSLATKVGKSVTDVLTSAKSLKNLLEAMKDALRQLAGSVRAKSPDVGDVFLPSRLPSTPPARTALPDISDLSHPRDGGDLDAWADAVAGRHPDLTPDEVKAIYRYTTDDGYEEMNGFLRGTSPPSPQDAARIQRDVDDAVAGLSKLPQTSGTYFRGTDLPADVLQRWQPGEKVSDPAFWSTSTKPSIAEEFRNGGNAFITIRGGRRGVDVRALSHYGREAEVLVLPGAPLRVMSREWDPGGFWQMAAREVVDDIS